MELRDKYPDEHNEFLHPLWLGILMLFSVITFLGMLCFIRRQCGTQIRHLFKVLCCVNGFQDEQRPKLHKQLTTTTNPYNWTPVYNPAPNLSPKLYSLVRNMQMTSAEKEPSVAKLDASEDDDVVENDIFSIPDESDQVKTSAYRKASQSSQGSNRNRNCETARKFYASMRQTSQCQASSSLDSSNNDSLSVTHDRLVKTNPVNKLKTFRTPYFFQSIGKSTH